MKYKLVDKTKILESREPCLDLRDKLFSCCFGGLLDFVEKEFPGPLVNTLKYLKENKPEVFEIYMWYCSKYRSRLDAMVASQFDEVCIVYSPPKNEAEERILDEYRNKYYEIQKQYDIEDTEMLKKLIDIRGQLYI